ncbi:MAG: ABC transporter permease [Phycisphaeraceae bacterium]
MNGKELIHFGQLTTRRSVLARSLALISGGMLWLLLFLILPAILIMAIAFTTRSPDGEIIWSFTTDNFTRLLGFGPDGWSSDFLTILWRSVWMAALTTILAIALALPLAFFIARQSKRMRFVWLSLIMIPMCTNLVVRTYAWELFFSPQLPPSQLAAILGIIDEGRGLYPGLFAVMVGMVANALPFAVLPLYASVERMDWSIVEAARDLYASRRLALRQAILPQVAPGIGVAVILTFVPAMGMFVITDRLSGATFMIIGNAIEQQFNTSRDYPFGAALSFVLIALTLAGLWWYRRKGKAIELM